MRVLMMTNTYLPHVGGVARSVESFTRRLRDAGHRVLVVAPEFDGRDPQEEDTIRVPAIQKFNGSDFSVRLPILNLLADQMEAFKPDIIHSHHPFLLGDTALRIAAAQNTPLVTTHHTMYEQYTHYTPVQFPMFERFVVHMATEYANLCQQVIAPSQSIADVLTQRGVTAPISVIPTGIDLEAFGRGDARAWRHRLNIPGDCYVVGTVGRLAPEKNLKFLADAVATFLADHEQACFLVVGSGPSKQTIEDLFAQRGLEDRLFFTGSLQGQELVDAYHAMDVFAFASQSETQGLVLAEAMATGRPVVAVNASGVREALRDGENGIMLRNESVDTFAAALRRIAQHTDDERQRMRQRALATAAEYDAHRCTGKLSETYQRVAASWSREHGGFDLWNQLMRRAETEWNLLSQKAGAIIEAIREDTGARLGS